MGQTTLASQVDFDVVVIGGGPGGSVLASLLAQQGRSVLVVEKDVHPRDHVGESLTPSTINEIIWLAFSTLMVWVPRGLGWRSLKVALQARQRYR